LRRDWHHSRAAKRAAEAAQVEELRTITPQLATQEVPLGSPPPLTRDGEVQERLEDRRGGLAVVIGAELHREQRRGRQNNAADAMASKAASLLRRAFQLVFDPLLLVDQGPTPEGSLSAQRAA
jgi:hypothetical protein